MKKLLSSLSIMLLLFTVTGYCKDSSREDKTVLNDSIYLEGTVDKALILAHGKGKHPKWKVVDPLRKSINETLDYHTLSLQMPNDNKNWKQYADDFPEAYETIEQAISFLHKKGIKEIYLMGHSMGSRMTSSFLSEVGNPTVKGFIAIGCRNNGGYPFSCVDNISEINDIPILDIWGANNKKDSKSASKRKYLISDTYKQISINGANHKLDGYDKELTEIVVDWLKSIQNK